MSAKKIIAMFAVVGAQDAPDGRIFSDDFNGVNVNDFLYNSDSSYIYENLDANYGANYANYGDYDGTANQPAAAAAAAADTAGRPNAGDAGAGEKSLNMDSISKASGYNTCTVCTGQTAAECAAADATEQCNDAQDACQIEVRSEYVGNAVVHKFWSGCASQFACNERFNNNFYSTNAADASRNLCKGVTGMSRRFYSPSQCTLCARLGLDAGDDNTILFGVDDDQLDINEDGTGALSWATILNNPLAAAADMDLYNTQTFASV